MHADGAMMAGNNITEISLSFSSAFRSQLIAFAVYLFVYLILTLAFLAMPWKMLSVLRLYASNNASFDHIVRYNPIQSMPSHLVLKSSGYLVRLNLVSQWLTHPCKAHNFINSITRFSVTTKQIDSIAYSKLTE